MSDKDKWNKRFYEQEKKDTGKAEDEGFSDNSGVFNNDMSQYTRFGNSSRFYYAVVASNYVFMFNPLNAELNPICYLLALLAHHFLHVSRIRVKSLTLRLLMSYTYGAPTLDVSRSHTTTHHTR